MDAQSDECLADEGCVYVRVHVRKQTDLMPQTAQTTWDGYWCAVCLLSRRRRGGQGEVYECVCI